MSVVDLGLLDFRTAIVDHTGRPTAEFQRRWNIQRNNNSLIGSVTIGSGAPTGTPNNGDEYVDSSTAPYSIYFGNGGSWHIASHLNTDDLPEGSTNLYFTDARAQAALAGQLSLKADKSITLTAGTGLTGGGDLSINRTFNLANTAVTAGSYTNASITVDAQGRITAASSGSVTIVLGFALGDGSTGTNVSTPALAPRTSSITTCKFVTKASDGSVDLTFLIKKNGVNIFSSNPTVTHGTSAGTVSTFTSLTSSPLSIAAYDVFTLDITSGSSSWSGTIQLG